MRRAFTIATVLAIVVVVISVFISPAVDLEPTALRAMQGLIALFSVFTLARMTCSVFQDRHCKEHYCLGANFSPQTPPLLDLNCSRLC